jgi:hypothetical protein
MVPLLISHETGSTFDGVSGTIYLVDQILVDIGPVFLDRQEIVFNVRKMFQGFFYIHPQGFVILNGHGGILL